MRDGGLDSEAGEGDVDDLIEYLRVGGIGFFGSDVLLRAIRVFGWSSGLAIRLIVWSAEPDCIQAL